MKKLYKKEIIDTWIEDNESLELIEERFVKLNGIMSFMYDFILAYSNYYSIKRDYGTGDKLTMIEAHILTDIYDNSGITVTELACKWHRTSSAISQVVKKLMKSGFVERINNKDNAKIFHLIPTKNGKVVVIAHKKYDNLDIIKTRKKLLEKFSLDEIISFDKICKEYTKILRKKQ